MIRKLHYLHGLTLTLLLTAASGSNTQAQELQRVWSPPPVGTFWSAHLTNLPPLPFLPDFLAGQVPVYSLGENGVFLYDDSTIDVYRARAYQRFAPPCRRKRALVLAP